VENPATGQFSRVKIEEKGVDGDSRHSGHKERSVWCQREGKEEDLCIGGNRKEVDSLLCPTITGRREYTKGLHEFQGEPP